jgi:hypothetical protein
LIKAVLVLCIPIGILSIAGQGHFAEDRDSYAALLAEIDRDYPALNPKSPRYNASLEERVARRHRQLRASGMSESQALRQAFGEICSPQTGGRICQ